MRWTDAVLDAEGLGDPMAICETHARQIHRTVTNVVWLDEPPRDEPTRQGGEVGDHRWGP
jgi:hypothetical protein